MTKVLSAVRHLELCRTDLDLDAVPAASIMIHTVFCRHVGWQSLGAGRRREKGGRKEGSRSIGSFHISMNNVVHPNSDKISR